MIRMSSSRGRVAKEQKLEIVKKLRKKEIELARESLSTSQQQVDKLRRAPIRKQDAP